MFDAGLTLHLSIPEVIVVGVVLTLAVLRELLHLIRSSGRELLDFLRWWRSFRQEWRELRR